jgi:hypothetical protein
MGNGGDKKGKLLFRPDLAEFIRLFRTGIRCSVNKSMREEKGEKCAGGKKRKTEKGDNKARCVAIFRCVHSGKFRTIIAPAASLI